MAAQTVLTRFLIISDTHGIEFEEVAAAGGTTFPPAADVILHCGDLTVVGDIDALKRVLRMMGTLNAELKLVIAGNHDLTLDPEYLKAHMHQGRTPEEYYEALAVMKGPLAKEAGVTYLEEGINTFTLRNGAKFSIYTTPYTPEFCDWGFSYLSKQDRFSSSAAVNPIPDFGTIDIVMTHGPPRHILDECAQGSVGCGYLLRAVSRCRPRLHCFGHIHEGHGASLVTWKEDSRIIDHDVIQSQRKQRNTYPEAGKCHVEFGQETLMVNAAIMDVHNHPVNPPWLIDLELPLAD